MFRLVSRLVLADSGRFRLESAPNHGELRESENEKIKKSGESARRCDTGAVALEPHPCFLV